MPQIIDVPRKCMLILLMLLVAGAGVALANHDPDIVHICTKNGHIEVVDAASACKQGETALGLATETALAALQSSHASLQSEIDALKTLVKRLHGNTAALIERSGGGTAPGLPGGYVIRVIFCEATLPSCDATTGIVLETALLTAADDGSIVRFDVANTPLSSLLTNGQDDVIRIERDYFDGNGAFHSGGAGSSPESGWFFATTQVSSGPGFVDLAGLEIGDVSLAIDRLSIVHQNNQTAHQIAYRIFFGLAD